MENKIDLSLVDDLQDLRDKKEKLEDEIRAVNSTLEEVETSLVDAMVTAELESLKRNGRTYSLRLETYASAKPEAKEELFQALRDNEAGDLVQEQVNAQSLRAFVKELKTNNDGEVPAWIIDYINIYEKSKIAVRKSN